MYLFQALSYGTAPYPKKVAGQLQVLNFACWSIAPMWLGFALYYFNDPKLSAVVHIDFTMAAIVAGIPLLHRFGSLAAPVAFYAVSYPATFVVCYLLGTDSGMQIHYLGFAACAALIFGITPILPSLVLAIIALAFIVALEIFAPNDGGRLSEVAMLASFVACVLGTGAVMFSVVFYAISQAARSEAAAEFEYKRSELLLQNILPSAIADRLKARASKTIADRYDHVSILFADMAGFTEGAGQVSAMELVSFLNDVFTEFDGLVELHNLEKIKTTGDNYMVVSGLPVSRSDHAAAIVQLGIEMLEATSRMRDAHGRPVSIRVGISTGPVVAGVVGMKKFFYDVWGDAVNVASRMESTGLPGRIQVCPKTYRCVEGLFDFEERGPIEIKGKGKMSTWLIKGPRAT
ncbi:adenylate/guanylate cyclase domain-containing protein [Phyllobacterium sp. SYP-B3895]|nr:adenylate/guanylate cyclase domain-containing protein [Phyllobacterium sp. SYP-B3895]MRG57426.1 adenylate/guanylate cyclase domain-containing protein [Phyllobacterium sp. SYP-B3895]